MLWDVAARKRLVDAPLPVNEGLVQSMAFSPDGKTIAAGYNGTNVGGGLVLWDATAQAPGRQATPLKEGGVESVAFSPDGRPSRPDSTVTRPRRSGAVERSLA